MIKKLYFLSLLFLIFVRFTANAQGELQFEKEVHDFGTIAEGTQVSYVFRVKNIGNEPVIISGVQPSCGCTTPTWTKEPILPGKIGTIKAEYNSAGRPGAFNKSINVVSNAATQNRILYIKGEVGPKDLNLSYTPEQKALSPRLAVGSTNYSFGKLEKGQKVVAKFRIRNNGRQPLIIQGVKSACNCVIYRTSVPEIKAGEIATLELRYDAAVLGEQKEIVTVLSNDIVMPGLKLTLRADVVEPKAAKDIVREGATPKPYR
ncbi:DUF1573 domain-containing protein [Pontibacter akesuensis]|uniref:DUF1573 domain-containing protein n=1 Tax=Pontibacter akesuensis TaxID=388950 RepID=A0A1I7GE05_9BACT|nr:DUF1573 domain-containing protein [Pontibacter akesuensis]GHA57296.1 hypothetical protein GCM10007389_06240 [Pontibacter akesuensis]SFU46684.1 Protein of unknown function [Pontibacter akesuensis]